jgi:uncharacterized DUF497 family protein
LIKFEWDSHKANLNVAKHGIDFEDAKTIFLDPKRLQTESYRNEEARYLVVGKVEDRVIVVVYVVRGEYYRLISARRAREYEKKRYGSQ